MKKFYQASLVLSAIDKMTNTVNKAFTNVQRRMQDVQKGADKFARQSAVIARQSAMIGMVAAAPLIYSGKKAVEFEDKMADVGKVLNMKTGSEGLMKVGKDVRQLSVYLAKGQGDVAGLYANLAQGGVAIDNLSRISRLAGEMGVAFDMAAELAGEKFMKIQNALGATTDQTKALTDTINFLSDKQAAKASQLVDFFSAGGASATNMLKVVPQVSAAFGTMFIAAGKSGEEAATIYERFTKGLLKGGNDASKIFQKSGGGLDGMLKVIEAGRKLSGAKQFKFFRAFGEYGPEVAQMANNFEKFDEVLKQAMDTQAQAGSVQKEFENRMSTTATKLAKAKVQFDDLAITVGNELLPVLTPLIAKASAFLSKVAKWIEANPKLFKQLVKGTAIFAGIAFAVSGVATVLSGVATIVSVASGAFAALSGALGFLSGAFGTLTAFMMANPIIAIATGIAIAAVLIYRNWDNIAAFFKERWEKVKAIFFGTLAVFGEIGKKLYDGGANMVASIWEGMKSMANKPVEAIREIARQVRQFLPFSPAKKGPFRDLHRVKIIETISDAMKPGPMVGAMRRATSMSLQPIGAGSGQGPGPSGQIVVNFSPTINLGGSDGNAPAGVVTALKSYEADLLRLIDEAIRRRDRKNF